MVLNSIVIGIILYLGFKIIGNGFKQLFSLNDSFLDTIVGFIVYFGIVQCLVYILNICNISSKLCAILFMGILILLICISLSKIKSLINKNTLFIILITIVISIVLTLRSGNYTVGSTSDSVFYMSMVNENAFSSVWTPLSYYKGALLHHFNGYYDFQSFYHFFAYIIKFYAQIFNEISYVPIYIYSALYLLIATSIDTLSQLFILVFKKNKWVAIIGLLLVICFNDTSWHLLYGYFGHSWRTLILSITFITIYKYLKTNDNKYLILLFLCTNTLIAVMSSALFVNVFIFISLFIIIFAYRNKNSILKCWICFLPTFIYLVTFIISQYYLSNFYYLLAIILFIILGLLILLLANFDNKIKTILSSCLIVICFIAMSLYGLFGHPKFGYSYFFGYYNNELSVPYFGYYNISLIITNILWQVGSIVFLIKNKLLLKTDIFKFLAIIIILFINPFVSPFIMSFLTSTVIYRSYEILINYYTCFLMASGIVYLIEYISKNKKIKQFLYVIIALIMFYPILTNFNNNPFYYDLDEKIDFTYRIPQAELEADLQVAKIANDSYERIKVVSQAPYTKGLVKNIELLYDINYTRSFCKSCNVLEESINAPSALHNLFMLRDYADQQIYSDTIDWDNACAVQYDSNYKILLLSKGQTKLKEDYYDEIWHDMRACNDVIYEGESYVVMEYR